MPQPADRQGEDDIISTRVGPGEPELAARIAAHCLDLDDPSTLPQFLRFALRWATSESQRFVAEVNAKKQKRKR